MYNGLDIETDNGDIKTAYAEVLPIELGNKSSMLQATLYQGLNRQIRKMFAKLGFEVISLKRVQHGTITLDGMKKGQIKLIKPKQLKELKVYLYKINKKADNDLNSSRRKYRIRKINHRKNLKKTRFCCL